MKPTMDSNEASWEQMRAVLKNTIGTNCPQLPAESEEDVEGRYEEANDLLRDYNDVRVTKVKVEKEMKGIEEGISRAQKALDKCEKKTKQLAEKAEKKAKKSRDAQNMIESALHIWDDYGFRMDVLEYQPALGKGDTGGNGINSPTDGTFGLKFTKIDPNDEKRLYRIKVSLKSNRVKFLEMEPTGVLSDFFAIEKMVNENTKEGEAFDFRHLVVMLRNSLCQSVSASKST